MSSHSRFSLPADDAGRMPISNREEAGSPESKAAASFSGRDMVCFSHDWSGDPLSKTHLMRILSRQNRVLWVNSIGYRTPTVSKADLMRVFHKLKAAMSSLREVEPNIFVLNPLALPFYRFAFVRQLNRLLLRYQVKRSFRRLGFSRPIDWVFNPAAAIIAGSVGEDKMIYYCVDEYAAFEAVDATQFAALEEELLLDADLVIVSARNLHQTKSKTNPQAHLVRHGVDFAHFRTSLDNATTVPEDLFGLPRPIIGYIGLMSNDWVDVDLLMHTAKTFSSGSLVMLGKVPMDLSRLASLPNVHLPGRVPYTMLPAYCKGFDVAIIPFPISDVTLNANPLKAREYLAAGLPVVSTPIPEVEILGNCFIGGTPDEFVNVSVKLWKNPARAWNGVKPCAMKAGSHASAKFNVSSTNQSQPRRSGIIQRPDSREYTPNMLIIADLKAKAQWCYNSTSWQALLKVCATDGTCAMFLYRLMQWSRRWRLIPLEMICNRSNTVFCQCLIGRGAEFGPGFVLIHSQGVVINGSVRGGKNIHVEHQVTIGAERNHSPILGSDIFIGAGAQILGAVSIGDHARIGANAVVVHDVPPDTTVVGIPARVVRTRQTDDAVVDSRRIDQSESGIHEHD